MNRGLSLNIRSINSRLSKLFQRYSIALNKISGSELFGKTQTKQIQDANGVATEYSKGRIVFRNGIDKLKFLLDNKEVVAEEIGVSSDAIFSERRNYRKMLEYISRTESKYDLGNQDELMQMYISMHDNNVGLLDEPNDWVGYILTQSWINKLAQRSVSSVATNDSKIEYLQEMISRMLKDHELSQHKDDKNIDFSKYLGTNTDSRYENALNMLNSLDKLGYGLYEFFKPIGGTTDRYIKVKLSSNEELEIQGTLSLEDCTHVVPEHGSMEHLRSLDTDNQRYEFLLQLPICDLNSVVWHKLDEQEELVQEVDEDDVPEVEEEEDTIQPQFRYYKPYNTEMLMKWLGTTYVPMFDMDTITKMTVCETPKFQSTVQRESFFQNTDGILEEINRIDQVSDQMPFMGLHMFPRASIDLVQRDDGQYLQFVVSGNQGTKNLTFHIRGKMMPIINYVNRYAHTLDLIGETYVSMTKEIMFLEATRGMSPVMDEKNVLEKIWELTFPGKDFIPQEWLNIQSKLEQLVWSPTTSELMRLRQIDFESIMENIITQSNERRTFLLGISGKNEYGSNLVSILNDYLMKKCPSQSDAQKAFNMIQGRNFYNYYLDYLIWHYDQMDESQMQNVRESIGMDSDVVDTLKKTLESLHTDRFAEVYELGFETTVEEFRETIEEFNGILPTLSADTMPNKISSKHTLLDWQRYFEESTKYLVEHGLLFVKTDENGEIVKEQGMGTDEIVHQYVEYYVDIHCTEPVIDYSYCYDTSGNPIHDRFDYWSVEDFS